MSIKSIKDKLLHKSPLGAAGSEFIQAAKDFEKSEIASIKYHAKIYRHIMYVALAISAVSIGAVIGLTPLKSVQPFVVRVDKNTGITDVVSVLKTSKQDYGEVIDKYWLAQYVKFRESYDWETIGATYDATRLFSEPIVSSEFEQLYDQQSPTTPLKILKDNYKVIAKVRAISFVGKMAQVRFEKDTIALGSDKGNKIPPQHFIATIAYAYKNTPSKESERLVNPLGFQVLSYRVDPETSVQ